MAKEGDRWLYRHGKLNREMGGFVWKCVAKEEGGWLKTEMGWVAT